MANTKITSNVISDDIALGGNPTTTTQSAGNDTTRIATTAFVKAAIDATIDSAPGALDTLNELAAAIGDYANFSTTITNSIATKLPLAGGTMTGDLILGDNVKVEIGSATGGDLQLYHDGSDSYISDAGTGLLKITGSEIRMQTTSGENMAIFNPNGAVQLQYDNATKLSTTSTGIDAPGLASVGHVVPNTAGTYTVNHLGVYSSGITLNAATSQTGWLMAAGNGKLSFASDGAKVGADGLGFHTTMNNRIETDQTTATRMKFYLNDTVAGEWKRTGSGGSIRPNQYSSGDTAANLPALASYDDENTGVYFPAADSIGISVGGSQAMLFDDDKFATIGSESGIPNSLAGLQIKRGGLLINGTSNTTNFHTTSFLSNYWTYFGSSGASGTYSGSFRVSVPSPTGTAGNAWGGFQLEIYISGYNTKFCHAILSGYTNGGITLSEATILRSSGSHSVSYGNYHTGGNSNQGFYFDINIPSYTHPSAFYRITKGGDTSSDHETALGRDLVVAWS